MPTISIHLFGAPRIERDGAAVTVERRKSLALLAYLAVMRQPHGRDALATLLWPDADAEHARAGLRRTLVDLNATLGKGWLDADGDQIALRDEPGLQVDVERFHAVLAQAAVHSHPPHRLCDVCLANLAEAAGLYTADFLAGFTLEEAAGFDDWQTFQTESLRLELAAALEKLAQGLAGRQQWEVAISHARRWLALDPLNESAHRFLMQLHAGAGDRAAAIRQYQECVHVLQEELGIEPEPETTAIFDAIRAARSPTLPLSSAPQLPFSPALAHNLPPDPTPFVGREAELAQIAQRLGDPACRLLTVLGPGGMGKTRLAIQAVRRQTEVLAHGVFFVDLAAVASADFLAAAVVRALPITPSAADAQVQLTGFLRDKHLLLVLDNFEHLVEGCGLLSELLRAAPKLKLLVTSRVRLNLREEWLAPLAGLELPPEGLGGSNPPPETERPPQRPGVAPAGASHFQPADFQSLEHYSATALFLGCIRRLRPDFQPTADDARHIAHICRLLDGTPLAIELAAAWQRALPLGEIARELERGLSLLATKTRGVPERQRSMTATFDYSWGLLSPHERSILRQASVFRGGFTREAAEVITGATLVDLDSLVDASWISLRVTGRYELHELIHQYCAEKLENEHVAQAGETADQARDRHAAYYRALLLARQGEFYRQPGSVSEVAAERDNLLAAWNWCATSEDLDGVRTIIPGLCWIAEAQGWGRALRSLLEGYARQLKEDESVGNDDPGRCSERALTWATVLTAILGEWSGLSWDAWQTWVGEAESVLAQGVADDESRRDARWQEVRWMLRFKIALAHWHWADSESSHLMEGLLPELEEGHFSVWPHSDDARLYYQMQGYRCLGFAAIHRGEEKVAQRLAEQSIALAERIGAPLLKTEGLHMLSHALIYQGDCQQAEKHARALLQITRAYGQEGQTFGTIALWTIGLALAGQGSYFRARACFRRTVAWGRENGPYLVQSLHHLGGAELALGNLAHAKRFYREMISVSEDLGIQYGVVAALTGLARVALATGKLAEAKEHLFGALKRPPHSRILRHTIEAIAAMAEIQQMEGQWAAATELCAALLSWPATPHYAAETTQHLRAELEARLRQLEAQLSPALYAAAVERGRARQIDEVVAELVGEPAHRAADENAALI